MADQMPAERQLGRSLHFLNAFLDFVLAEVDLAGVGGGPNVFGVEGLWKWRRGGWTRVAPGPAGGARDAFANVSQPGSKRGGIEHYFFS